MSSVMLKPDPTLSLTISPPNPPEPAGSKPEDRGILLIKLLISCAKHASSGNLNRADTCLQQIMRLASPSGDSMQRLAARFASALAIRLVKRWPGLYKALNQSQHPKPQSDRAKTLFARFFPYLTFAYAIIARTLLRSLTNDRVIHIIDLGPDDSKLWVPLLRSFARMHIGLPHVKITCVSNDKVALQKLGSRLVKEAEALDMSFQFHPVFVTLRDLTIDMLEVRSGEALAFVSVLNLHVLLAEDDQVDARFGLNKNNNDDIKDSKKMTEFLSMIRSLSPKIIFLVEQESDQNLNRLPDRFVQGLHYYSALFDAIDATFSDANSSEERLVIEDMFGREIDNIVACEGLQREERHERYGRWVVRFTRAGFRPVRLWCDPLDDAKKMVKAYGKEGYKISSERSSLMICWHERPLYAVSAWTS